MAIGPALARQERLRPGRRRSRSPRRAVRSTCPMMSVQYDGNFGGRNVLMSYDLMLELYGDRSRRCR